MAVLLLTTAVVIGCLLMRLANPAGELGPRWAALLLELGFGGGFGIALISLVFFVLLLIHAATAVIMVPVELLLLAVSAALLFVRRKRKTRDAPRTEAAAFWWYFMLGGALAVGVIFVAAAMANSARTIPFGTWDAWNIWNLRARYLAGPGDAWKFAFSPLLNYLSHADYPPLLSGFVAQAWKISGEQSTTLTPILTASVFTASAALLLISALALVRGVGSALLAGLVLVSTGSYLGQMSSQYADVPLSFYYLGTIILIVISMESEGPRKAGLAAMAGAFASFAAWTKNEGVVFLALSLGCYFLVSLHRRSPGPERGAWWHMLLGAIPGLFVVAYFKMFLAPPNDLVAQPAAQVLHKLVQFSRYWILAKSLVARALELGGSQVGSVGADGWTHPLFLLAILGLTLRFRIDERQKRGVTTGWLLLILLFFSYCGVYLITPLDLRFQLSTSLARLYAQMWPGFLFLVFLSLARPEDLFQTPGDNFDKTRRSSEPAASLRT